MSASIVAMMAAPENRTTASNAAWNRAASWSVVRSGAWDGARERADRWTRWPSSFNEESSATTLHRSCAGDSAETTRSAAGNVHAGSRTWVTDLRLVAASGASFSDSTTSAAWGQTHVQLASAPDS